MKKKNLIILLASLSLLLASCGKKSNDNPGDDDGGNVINHQSPFVTVVENPSQTRAFDENFDYVLDDFSGETLNGTTTGVRNESFLRVLVDSNDRNEPTTPDAAIYKMATGSYEIENFEGIGFRIRKVGDGVLPLSNLVLGLRGDDKYNVFPIKLSDASDPDGEALPELTNEFKDLVVSPGQSIADANTLYQFNEKNGGGMTNVKVLDKILGFHLYALSEECSAVVEIEKVYLINAGDETILDNFNRVNVAATDSSCYWRDSTGFIVQKGVNLKNAKYEVSSGNLEYLENLVINIMGDASGLKVNNVSYANLKDSEGTALTGAVNGAFYSYVINFEQSNITFGSDFKLTVESTTEVIMSEIFLTDLEEDAPVYSYPYIDIGGASYVTKFDFTVAKGTFKEDYDTAVEDTRVTASGLNYAISYNGKDNIESVDGHLKLYPTAADDYSELVIGSNADANKDYLVFAMKYDTVPTNLRIKTNKNPEIYASNWVADAGLPSFPTVANYPYVTADGYTLIIVDLAKTGFPSWSNEIDIYYTGSEELLIDSIFFADEYVPDVKFIEHESATFNVGVVDTSGDYGYVGAIDVTGYDYVKIETTATAANDLRFGFGADAVYISKGEVIDYYGDVVTDEDLTFIIDLEASHVVLQENAGLWFHIHSTKTDTAFTLTATKIEVSEPMEIIETELNSFDVDAGNEYGYVGAVDVTGYNYVKIETTATAANLLRFGLGPVAVYLNSGNIIDENGKPVPDGSTSFIINLIASNIVLDARDDGLLFHVHSQKTDAAFTLKVSGVSIAPKVEVKTIGEAQTFTVKGGAVDYGYVGAVDATGANAVLIKTTATAVNELRFGFGPVAVYLNSGNLIDIYSQFVSVDATKFTIDFEASNIVLDERDDGSLLFHIHSTIGSEDFQVTVTLLFAVTVGSYAYLLAQYNG